MEQNADVKKEDNAAGLGTGPQKKTNVFSPPFASFSFGGTASSSSVPDTNAATTNSGSGLSEQAVQTDSSGPFEKSTDHDSPRTLVVAPVFIFGGSDGSSLLSEISLQKPLCFETTDSSGNSFKIQLQLNLNSVKNAAAGDGSGTSKQQAGELSSANISNCGIANTNTSGTADASSAFKFDNAVNTGNKGLFGQTFPFVNCTSTGFGTNSVRCPSSTTRFGSNAQESGRFGSNAAGFNSNASKFNSNAPGSESTAAGFNSNASKFNSNAPGSGFRSNSVGFGSNFAGFQSNATRFGSNATGFGSIFTGFQSNVAEFGSNSRGINSNATGFASNSFGTRPATFGSTPEHQKSFFGSAASSFGSTSPFKPQTSINPMISPSVTSTEATVTFKPPTVAESIVISTRLQCISAMEEYKNKSLEELRFEDYTHKHKGVKATNAARFGSPNYETSFSNAFTNFFALPSSFDGITQPRPFSSRTPRLFSKTSGTSDSNPFERVFKKPSARFSSFQFSTPATPPAPATPSASATPPSPAFKLADSSRKLYQEGKRYFEYQEPQLSESNKNYLAAKSSPCFEREKQLLSSGGGISVGIEPNSVNVPVSMDIPVEENSALGERVITTNDQSNVALNTSLRSDPEICDEATESMPKENHLQTKDLESTCYNSVETKFSVFIKSEPIENDIVIPKPVQYGKGKCSSDINKKQQLNNCEIPEITAHVDNAVCESKSSKFSSVQVKKETTAFEDVESEQSYKNPSANASNLGSKH